MTVEDLIDKLSQIDPLMDVLLEDDMGVLLDPAVYVKGSQCVLAAYDPDRE